MVSFLRTNCTDGVGVGVGAGVVFLGQRKEESKSKVKERGREKGSGISARFVSITHLNYALQSERLNNIKNKTINLLMT
jgi:hypothetical protein